MKELILTGLYELWPSTEKEKEALYLGPWCFAGNHKDFLRDQDTYKIAPSIWKSWDDVAKAQKYIDSLSERVILSLRNDMSRAYNVDHEVEYWRVIFTFWLLHWLAHVYDRYLCLLSCLETSEDVYHVKVVNSQFEEIVTYNHLTYMQSTHEYNLELFSDILRIIQPQWKPRFQIESVSLPKPSISSLRNYTRNLVNIRNLFVQTPLSLEDRPKKIYRTRTRRILKDLLTSFYDIRAFRRSLYRAFIVFPLLWRYLNIFCYPVVSYILMIYYFLQYRLIGRRRVLLNGVYGIDSSDIKELRCHDGAVFFKRIMSISKTRYGPLKKDEFLNDFIPKNDFESIIKQLIGKYMPIELKQYRSIPQFMLKGLVHFGVYAANPYLLGGIIQNQSKVISVQHGGGYGTGKVFPLGLYEYQAISGFINWGWSHQHNYSTSVVSMPSPMLSKLCRSSKIDDTLYFISTAHPIYYYRFHSDLRPEMIKNYINNKIYFLNELKIDILLQLMYRPYSSYYGASELKYILQKLPASAIVFDQNEHNNRLLNSRLVIIDHSATSHLQTFAANVPTILFWDKEQHAFCEEAQIYYDKLRDVKILFDDPVAAARHINRIWNDVEEWWEQDELQAVRADFCNKFARTSENWQDEWRVLLKKLRRKNYDSVFNIKK